MNLQHVAIGIAHDGAERARAFYGGVLGLEERALPAGVDPERFIWFAVGEGLDLHLHVLDGDDPPAVRSHFCLLVGDELEPLRARVEASGIATRDPRLWPGRGAFFCCPLPGCRQADSPATAGGLAWTFPSARKSASMPVLPVTNTRSASTPSRSRF